MLPGFEDHTADLSEEEKELIPVFIKGFETKYGKENAVTSKEIVARLQYGYKKITEVRVRKIINHIRNNNLIPGLVASSSGYYVTSDPQEIKRYIDSLDGREAEIRRTKQSFKQYLNQLLNHQQQQINYGA